MEFYHVTVDIMTTSYALNIKLSDKFNTKFFVNISNFFKVILTSNCTLSFRLLKQDSQNRLILKTFYTSLNTSLDINSQSDTVLDQYTKFFKNFMKDIFHVCRIVFFNEIIIFF